MNKVKNMIPLFKVHMSETIPDKVSKILMSGYIGQGPVVDEFEELFYTNVQALLREKLIFQDDKSLEFMKVFRDSDNKVLSMNWFTWAITGNLAIALGRVFIKIYVAKDKTINGAFTILFQLIPALESPHPREDFLVPLNLLFRRQASQSRL